MVDDSLLPTHIARVLSRLNIVGYEASGDTFLLASYVVESIVKTLAIALCASVRKTSQNNTYKFEYDLVRGDSLGTWESTISTITSHAYVGYVTQELQSTVAWLTKKRTRIEDEWVRQAAGECFEILQLLGATDNEIPRIVTAKYLFSQLVQIRNKTKAHGAVGPDFFKKANPHYVAAVKMIIDNLSLLNWEWFFISLKDAGHKSAVSLTGNSPHQIPDNEPNRPQPDVPGVYFRTHPCGILFSCDPLIITNEECSSFYLPNGGFTATGRAEYIDYYDGNVMSRDCSVYVRPPAPLPPSVTEGVAALDIFSNVFGNLPQLAADYVERGSLQEELVKRLMDKNHAIITLHGRGGIGKTSLALFVAHQFAKKDSPPFEYVVWLSARDLELRISGAAEVRRAVGNLDDICRTIGGLFGIKSTRESLAEILQNPSCVNSTGVLFIFDNFETLDDPRGIHEFLDTHTHIPNKVLITSRERAFKGDFPIEVGGMELEEAKILIRNQAVALGIEGIINSSRTDDIIEYTNGHPYVMRVLLGEVAKEAEWIPLKSLVPRRIDLLNAVFERSFNKLSTAGRLVFLTIGNWRSVVSELSVLAVLGVRDIDVESGLEECLRLSLISRHELSDGHFCYSTPELAHLFAKKKLDGDPDRLVILEDIDLLRQFGQMKPSDIAGKNIDEFISKFMSRSADLAFRNPDMRVRLEAMMAKVSELWPKGWLYLADYRELSGAKPEDISYALRRAVEEMPYNKDVWLRRAKFAEQQHNKALFISSMVSAVEADPANAALVSEVAFQLVRYIDEQRIPPARRGVYLASVRTHMQKIAHKLNATALSRLAWLFLLEDNGPDAWKYANQGLAKEPENEHCLKLTERLRSAQHA